MIFRGFAELWWYLAVRTLIAVIVAATLFVFRIHGYRIRTGIAE